jgi:hypothetical protein
MCKGSWWHNNQTQIKIGCFAMIVILQAVAAGLLIAGALLIVYRMCMDLFDRDHDTGGGIRVRYG